ncbi:hypothetical protein SDC9_202668 [bioreactor metagenome]|uniref:Uncharacterized protein n=1 Tax=bioreactor metagenome TaxID=1076179 RepID=A0A645IX20_9ZZZZ
MAHELNKFFQARRKFGIDMSEASRIFGEQRALRFGTGELPFGRDDELRMETFCGQRERDKKAAQESAKAEYRRLRGA